MRTFDEINKEHRELLERLWWHRHQSILIDIREGRITVDPRILQKAEVERQRIERKYSVNGLKADALEVGLMVGRVSALTWVMYEDLEWADTCDE